MACTFLLASAPPAPGPTRTITILQVLRRSSLLLAGVLALASRAGGQAVLPSATYVGEHWTVADGLPINTITSLVQSRDGYLWLGTNDGVVRFDGVRFTVYNAGNTPEIPSNRIVSLHEDRAGALWILTEQQHLVRHLRGRFTHINAARGLKAGAVRLTEAADGTIVLATTRGVGIVQNGLRRPTMSGTSGRSGSVSSRHSIRFGRTRGSERCSSKRISPTLTLKGRHPQTALASRRLTLDPCNCYRVAHSPFGR